MSDVPQRSKLLFNFISIIEVGMKSSISVFSDDTKLRREINLAQDAASLHKNLDKGGGWAAT